MRRPALVSGWTSDTVLMPYAIPICSAAAFEQRAIAATQPPETLDL
jgi:hypothetical protein